MTAKPSYPAWIPSNSGSAIIAPSTAKLATGWIAAEKPAFQHVNWFFNNVSQWVNFLGPLAPDAMVGNLTTYPFATHATLAAAVADATMGTNARVLLIDSQTISTTVALTKAGWKVRALPGVVYTDVGGGTPAGSCLSCQADDIEIESLKLVGFLTSGIIFTAAGTYGRVWRCRFDNTITSAVDDSLAVAGKKPQLIENVFEL